MNEIHIAIGIMNEIDVSILWEWCKNGTMNGKVRIMNGKYEARCGAPEKGGRLGFCSQLSLTPTEITRYSSDVLVLLSAMRRPCEVHSLGLQINPLHINPFRSSQTI